MGGLEVAACTSDQRGEDGGRFDHGEGPADAGAGPRSERHELGAGDLRLGFRGEAVWVEAIRIAPNAPMAVKREDGNVYQGSR